MRAAVVTLELLGLLLAAGAALLGVGGLVDWWAGLAAAAVVVLVGAWLADRRLEAGDRR